MSLPLGKKPATYDRRDIRFADVRPANLDSNALPNLPKVGGGYGMDFGASGWSMLGNGPADDNSVPPNDTAALNGAGDCVWAGAAHEEMEVAHNVHRPIPKFTSLNILQQYSAYSGYDLVTGNNDNGSNVRDVLSWRQTKGLLDADNNAYKIGTYISLEPGNLNQLWEALYLFENVGIGINFPNSAMDQYNANQTWSVVPGANIEGGHYIPLVGHPTNNVWTCVTWAKRQTITPQFLTTYCDEAWAYIDPQRYNTVTGETPQHYKDADLEKYINLITTVK